MDDYKADYLIHTTASDGESTPTQIVKRAKELDYDIIAITDHDNTNGIAEAKIAAEAVDIKLIPGLKLLWLLRRISVFTCSVTTSMSRTRS